jgi:hypothetical protein
MAAWAVVCLLQPIARVRMAPAVAGITLPTLTACVPKTQQWPLSNPPATVLSATNGMDIGDCCVTWSASHDGYGQHPVEIRSK